MSLIQMPLNSALTNYYERQAQQQVEKKLEQMKADGVPLPDEPAKLKRFVHDTSFDAQRGLHRRRFGPQKIKQVEPERFANLDLAFPGKKESSSDTATASSEKRREPNCRNERSGRLRAEPGPDVLVGPLRRTTRV